jgi:septal ring factor EnvC (AmiA/AmiB activator)
MNKKIVIAAVVTLAVLLGAFFGGMASSDPTASTEYKSMAKKLEATKADLAETRDELDVTVSDLDDAEASLSDAEAQVGALTAEVPSD